MLGSHFYNETIRRTVIGVGTLFNNIDVYILKIEDNNIFLEQYDRFGIPFNAFYSSKFPEGIVMNEILTEKQIFETYNKVK